MIPGVDARINFAFRKLFGTDRNRPLTISLLNAALERTGRPCVVEVELLDTVHSRDNARGKESILDIRARDQSNRRFIVEMQMVMHRDLVKRLLFYWARGYSRQLEKGKDYSALQPTILICILDEPLFPDDGPYHRVFRLNATRQGPSFRT